MNQALPYPLGINLRDVIGLGNTAFVARFDAIIKFGRLSNLPLLQREARIYERLGHDHDAILRYYGNLGDALILQYACHGSIRQYHQMIVKPASLSLQLRWIEQITASIVYIHSRHVLHGDISCNNVMVNEDLDAKLGDFAGSSIDGEMALICYETSHELPDADGISTASELFALGSTFYEIMTGEKPYKGVSDEEVVLAFSKGHFPSVASLPAFKDIIQKCWNQGYSSAEALLKDVKDEVAANSKPIAPTRGFTLCYTAIPIGLSLLSLLPVVLWVRNRR